MARVIISSSKSKPTRACAGSANSASLKIKQLLGLQVSLQLWPELLIAALILLIGLVGCGDRSAFTHVEFRAPSQPDPVLRPYLAEVDHIGVVCATNIEPFRELDIEKVMARLSNAVVRSLGNMPKTEVMNQDEITYKLNQHAGMRALQPLWKFLELL